MKGGKPFPDVVLCYLYCLDLEIRLGFLTLNPLGLWEKPEVSLSGFLPLKGASRSRSYSTIFCTEHTMSSRLTGSSLWVILFTHSTMSFPSIIVKSVHFPSLERSGNQPVDMSCDVDLGIPNTSTAFRFGTSCSTSFKIWWGGRIYRRAVIRRVTLGHNLCLLFSYVIDLKKCCLGKNQIKKFLICKQSFQCHNKNSNLHQVTVLKDSCMKLTWMFSMVFQAITRVTKCNWRIVWNQINEPTSSYALKRCHKHFSL